MILLLILSLLENYYIEVIYSKDILDFKVCQEKDCSPLIDRIIPLKENRFFVFLPSLEGVNFYRGNSKVRDIKIVDSGNIKGSLGTFYVENLDLEKYDYFLRQDDRGIWKLDSIIDKKGKREIFSEEQVYLEKKAKRALYIWNTIEIIKEEEGWKEILRKLKNAKIERVYLQIPYELHKEKEDIWIKKRGKNFYKFLKFLMDNKFEIEILDGYKGFALEPLHYRLMNQLCNFKNFWEKYFSSKSLPPFHLDIEPYTLRFYNNKNSREIYEQFISLLKKIKRSFRDMTVYVDIPFWLDSLDGGRQILEEILDKSDGVLVMAYRSRVGEILDLSKNELNLALKKNKEIYIAIETQKIPDDKVYKIYKTGEGNFPFFLQETKREGLFILSSIKGRFGVDIFEETPEEIITVSNKSWGEIENFILELSKFKSFDGIAIHHWGSIKDKIK